MPRFTRVHRWLLAPLLAVAVLVILLSSSRGPVEPIHQGRRLSEWLKGHPKDYWPVVRAVGTNALPFLLGELQATDSALSRFGQRMLNKVSMGPFWRTARDRRYRARLAIQILGTNSAPALLDVIFARPIRWAESDPGYEAAFALSWLGSAEASSYARERVSQALRSRDPMLRRNACLVFIQGLRPTISDSLGLIATTTDTNASVRAAAVRALHFEQPVEALAIAVLIARLNDDQSGVRRLAIAALADRDSNAVSALPALRAAYPAERTRKSLMDDVDDEFRGPRYLSPEVMREAIRDAIKAIDPTASPPTDLPPSP